MSARKETGRRAAEPLLRNALLHRAEAKANRHAPDYDVLDHLVGFWIRRAQIRVLQSFDRHLGKLGLTPTQVAILVLIGANHGMSQIAVAGALKTDQSTMVSLIGNLKRRGLIARRRLPADNRFLILNLTPAGEELLQRAKRLLGRHNRFLLAALSDAESDMLLALLKRFAPI
jgi:DNA-binding MarR family transcriptional regulator